MQVDMNLWSLALQEFAICWWAQFLETTTEAPRLCLLRKTKFRQIVTLRSMSFVFAHVKQRSIWLKQIVLKIERRAVRIVPFWNWPLLIFDGSSSHVQPFGLPRT